MFIAVGPDVFTTPSLRFLLNTSGGTVTIGAGGRDSKNAVILSGGNPVAAQLAYPSAIQEQWFAFDFLTTGIPTSWTQDFAVIYDGATKQCVLRLNPGGIVTVVRGSTVIGTLSSFAMSANTHYHVEWHLKIHSSTGASDVWINNVQKFTGTGLNTQSSANASGTGAALANFNTGVPGVHKFRDIVVRDDQQSGDCRVREDLPTGTGSQDDGVSTGAADTRQAVDDSNPDDDTTFSELQNVNDLFLLTYPAVPTSAQIIAHGAMPYAKKSAAGTGNYKSALKIGATIYLGTEIGPSDGSYAYFPDLALVSPATGVAYTPTEINASELGAKRTA